jgi:ribosomal protein S25
MVGKKSEESKGDGEDKELKDKMAKESVEEKEARGHADEKSSKEAGIGEETKKKEEEMIKQLQEEIDKLATKDIISQMMMSLSSLAYKKMGIPSGVNDKFKDRGQAKMAVDAFAALLEVIKDEMSAQENENFQNSLSNLQLNFVKVF